jgi:hypothetical protein
VAAPLSSVGEAAISVDGVSLLKNDSHAEGSTGENVLFWLIEDIAPSPFYTITISSCSYDMRDKTG